MSYFWVYFGAALLATLAMPLFTRLARSFRILDQPGLRKVHRSAVPRIGGLPIVLAVLALTIAAILLDQAMADAVRRFRRELAVLLLGGLGMFAVGFLDDIRGVRALIKLLCLLAAATVLCASGARIEHINLGGWLELDLGWAAWPVTLLWIVGVTVGMNFIDGLDGLAGGIAAIVCGSIAVMALCTGQAAMAMLMLALLGALTGFLFYNYHPAKVFMGDGGAMFIGFLVGGGSVVCQAKTAALVGVALPGLALGVPLLDTFFTVIRRGVIERRSIFVAERGHLHHRLLDRGLGQQTVVFILYGVTIISAGAGVATLVAKSGWILALVAGGIVFLLAAFSLMGGARLRETYKALQRNMAIAQEARLEKSYLEDAELRIRDARSLEEWWRSVCLLAEQMGFQSLVLSLPQESRPDSLTWNSSGKRHDPKSKRHVDVVLPISMDGDKIISRMEVSIEVNGRLEAGGRRAALLGRLVDRYPLPLGNHLSAQAVGISVLSTSSDSPKEGTT